MLAVKEITQLIPPYGGALVDLLVSDDEVAELTHYANQLPSIRLSSRAVCDLELLAVGAFSPLDRFMSAADHQSVLDDMRLTNGFVFPIPIPLPIPAEVTVELRVSPS